MLCISWPVGKYIPTPGPILWFENTEQSHRLVKTSHDSDGFTTRLYVPVNIRDLIELASYCDEGNE